jgi:Na+-driven multidrug efflux pump
MAAPIILANISVPLLGAVNTAVVGHLPEPYYIGAVAIGAMLFNFIYHLFNCLRMGTTGPTAQARGAGNFAEVRAILGRALLLAASTSRALLFSNAPDYFFGNVPSRAILEPCPPSDFSATAMSSSIQTMSQPPWASRFIRTDIVT